MFWVVIWSGYYVIWVSFKINFGESLNYGLKFNKFWVGILDWDTCVAANRKGIYALKLRDIQDHCP